MKKIEIKNMYSSNSLRPRDWQINSFSWVLLEPVPVLMENPRIDSVWAWVWRIPDFFDWGWGCIYPRHNTHPRHISIIV